MEYSDSAYYSSETPILIVVNNIVLGIHENSLNLLILKRTTEPCAGQWSLVGDFVQPNESISKASHRILKERTGLTELYVEQLYSFGEIGRDAGGRVVSVAYWSLIALEENEVEIDVEGQEAKWVSIHEVPELVFDHGRMVQMAINRLRERARFRPIGFEILPKEFTIPQLLKVYEAIFDRNIDDRNFRKKFLNSGLLTKLPRKDMSTSKKGSFLYQFNEDVYKKLYQEGYSFGF